jgi:hypothetical protein
MHSPAASLFNGFSLFMIIYFHLNSMLIKRWMSLRVCNIDKSYQGQIPWIRRSSVRLSPVQSFLLWCLIDHDDLHTLYLSSIPARLFRTNRCWASSFGGVISVWFEAMSPFKNYFQSRLHLCFLKKVVLQHTS